jgi:hypothetical protein
MTSEQSRPAGSDPGDAGPTQSAQPSKPPVGKVRATASVPLPTRTPSNVPPEGEPTAATEQGRPGPFPPAGPTPPRVAQPSASAGKATVPSSPPGMGSPWQSDQGQGGFARPPAIPAVPSGPPGSFPGFTTPRAWNEQQDEQQDEQPGQQPGQQPGGRPAYSPHPPGVAPASAPPGYAGRAQVSAPPAGPGRAQVSGPSGGSMAYPAQPTSGLPGSAPPAGFPASATPASAPPAFGPPASAPPMSAPPYPGSPYPGSPYPGSPNPGSPNPGSPYSASAHGGPGSPYSGSPYGNSTPPGSPGPVYGGPASSPPATGMLPASAPPASYPGGPRYTDLVGAPGEQPPGRSPDELDSGAPGAPAPRKSRRALVVSLAIVAVVFLLAVAGTGIVVALNHAGDTTFAVNSCVKQSGDRAVKANCSDSGAFTVVSKVDRQESCADPNQPFIVLQHKGSKDQVLCLRPASQK